ncbi:hypothetical protein CWC11_21535, partial [Pseudoalteromonas sp. S3178]
NDLSLTISQTGTGNLVEGGMSQLNGDVSVTQVGDFNTTTITQK